MRLQLHVLLRDGILAVCLLDLAVDHEVEEDPVPVTLVGLVGPLIQHKSTVTGNDEDALRARDPSALQLYL